MCSSFELKNPFTVFCTSGDRTLINLTQNGYNYLLPIISGNKVWCCYYETPVRFYCIITTRGMAVDYLQHKVLAFENFHTFDNIAGCIFVKKKFT